MKFHHSALLLLPLLAATANVVVGQEEGEEADEASSCVAIRTETIGDCQFLDDPLKFVSGDDVDDSMTVSVTQSMSSGTLDWVGLQTLSGFDDDGYPTYECSKHDAVAPGSSLGTKTLTCDSVSQTAAIEIFVADSSIDELFAAEALDLYCDVEPIPSKICSVTYEFPCDCIEEDPNVIEEDDMDEEEDEVRKNRKLSSDGADANDNANPERKLDAEYASKPTESPTRQPTNEPTSKPSASPTESASPTSSPAPTNVGAPECDGLVTIPPGTPEPLPFCYDGNGYGGVGIGGNGKSNTTCYVLDESESCGIVDFVVEGVGENYFLRCSDVWQWFNVCVESYGCTPAHGSAKFYYGQPRRKTQYSRISRNPDVYSWEFLMYGNGVSGTFKWRCPDKVAAQGMEHFAKAIYDKRLSKNGNKRLFQTGVGTCESDAPSVSVAPTASPAPTAKESVDCKSLGYYFGYKSPRSSHYWTQDIDFQARIRGKPELGIQITKDCRYRIFGGNDRKDYYFDTPLPWVMKYAELYGGKLIKDNSKPDTELNGLYKLEQSDFAFYECNSGKWCMSIKKNGISVLGQDLVYELETRTWAERLRNLFRNIWRREIWQTINDKSKCGISPYCLDNKDYSTCHITPDSENCGPYDYLVTYGSGNVFRTNDPFEFMRACADRFANGCRPDPEYPWVDFGIGDISTNRWTDSATKTRMARFKRGSKYVRWMCDDHDSGNKMYDFFRFMDDKRYVRKQYECTEVPTESPTACQDSFLSDPPINIGIVIDISYSTRLYDFDGDKVGDLNNDGKANTILDAEIAGVEQLLKVIENSDDLNNDNVNIGVIVFESSGFYKGQYMPAGQYKPLDDSGNGVNKLFLEDLYKIKTAPDNYTAIYDNIGYTNFDDALDKSIEYYEERAAELGAEASDWTNLMVFLSDGVPNIRGDGDDEDWCNPQNNAINCNNAPPNKNTGSGVDPWLRGELSYCFSGDVGCNQTIYKPCVLGRTCESSEMVKSFDSEFARLDEFNVHRIAVGVGGGSDVSVDSALYRIDNNPNKLRFNLTPPQVYTTNDLASAFRNLCFANTANPTKMPSVSPTGVPTVTPTSTPTEQPTEDICDYDYIDFDGEHGIAPPNTWSNEYGMRIMSYTEADGYDSPAYYDVDGSDTLLVVPSAGATDDTVEMNTNGGTIIITQDLTQDKHMLLTLYGATDGVSIKTRYEGKMPEYPGEVASFIEYEGFSSTKDIKVLVDGIKQVEIAFKGVGGISKMRICRDGQRTKAPSGLATNGSTDMPTSSPTVTTDGPTSGPTTSPTSGSTDSPTSGPTTSPTSTPTMTPTEDDGCPPDAVLVHVNGHTPYPQNPIEVVRHGGDTVTFKVKQTWKETVGYIYTSYKKNAYNTECTALEQVEKYDEEEFTATCMHTAHVAIVDIIVSDPKFSELDDATVPLCCQKPTDVNYPTVSYTFEIKCDDPCPTPVTYPGAGGRGRPGNIGTTSGAVGPSNRKMEEIETEKKTTSGNAAAAGQHHCKPSQHPCGDSPNMVNVCHYSAKDGYKTFCVPDADSDIVAYYPNDSCGPCSEELIASTKK